MLSGLYSAASAVDAAEAQHRVIAENLANASVPGYRRKLAAMETFESALQQAGADPSATPMQGTRVYDVANDFTPGPVQRTGNPLDVAIRGDGFFAVNGPGGTLYTRNGTFQIDDQGRLTTSDGLPVAGDGGPLTLPAEATPARVYVSPAGGVYVDDTQVGSLKLVTFADNSRLEQAGTTLFRAGPGTSPLDVEVAVEQGVRELANVSAVDELVRMIVGMRHLEASQRAMLRLDEALGQTTDPQQA
jgi:flagellar basal body rod protein FlgG